LTSAPLNRRTKDQHHISPLSVAIYLSRSFLRPINHIEITSNPCSDIFRFAAGFTSTTTSTLSQDGQLNRLHRHPKRPSTLLLRSRHERPLHPVRSPNARRRCPISFPRRRHARSRCRDLDHFKAVSHSITKLSLAAKSRNKNRIIKISPTHPQNPQN
jgi:hypothetical protein